MPSFFDDMSRKANELALEADKKIRITKKQNEIGQIHKQVHQQMTLLGNTTYLVHQQGQALPPDVEAVCKAIDELYLVIKTMEAEIVAIRQEKISSPAPAMTADTVLCSSCGKSMPAHATFCPHCGAPQGRQQQDVRLCPHCGKPISLDARFCEFCGQSVSAAPIDTEHLPPQTIHCPDCGAELPATATFCTECGASIANVTSVENGEAKFDEDESGDANQSTSDTGLTETLFSSNAVDELNETPAGDVMLRSCPNCSELIPSEAMFCPVCGAVIS